MRDGHLGPSDRVKPGDFVILHLENSQVRARLVCVCVFGCVAVSTNTRSVARDLGYFAEHTGRLCDHAAPVR